jgi:hypothetical protein
MQRRAKTSASTMFLWTVVIKLHSVFVVLADLSFLIGPHAISEGQGGAGGSAIFVRCSCRFKQSSGYTASHQV